MSQAATAAVTSTILALLNPSNPKAAGVFSPDAVASGIIMFSLLVGACVFSATRLLVCAQPVVTSPKPATNPAPAAQDDQAWRDLLRAHAPSHLRPPIAWPTVLLALGGLAAWAGAL